MNLGVGDFSSNGASGTLGKVPVVACKDPDQNIIRIMKHPALENGCTKFTHTQNVQTSKETSTSTANKESLSAFGKKSKVPRPPNAFILYRQHWHPHYKQHNKSMHNIDISKEIGKRWKTEPEHIKHKYKTLAQELKEKHAAQYPNYQYAPRKPGEKKRRMTARKLAKFRETQQFEEAANFLTPESSSIPGTRSPGRDICARFDELECSILHENFENSRGSVSPPRSIRYQENDTYTTTLPNSYHDIQGEIVHECGQYGKDYVDILEDIDADEPPEEHLLCAHPGTACVTNQNEWESLIDWHGLNQSIRITEEMIPDAEDIVAEQVAGPDTSHKFYNASDLH